MFDAIKILSAGAVKPGLTKVIDAFCAASGTEVKISFATAPAIVEQIASGETFDLVIAPRSVLDDLANVKKVSTMNQTVLGRIGVGVMTREGASPPKISTIEEFKQSLRDADSLVYNQASTGIYLEALFDRLGVAADIKPKSTRYPDFAAVLDHVSEGKGRELGFGATTVIIENEHKGIAFIGSLPEELQNYTEYAAAVVLTSAAEKSVREFLRELGSPAARSLLKAAGIA